MPTFTSWLKTFGFDPKRCLSALRGIATYQREKRRFQSTLGNDFTWGKEFPILDERGASSGSLGAYFHQDLLLAEWIYRKNPVRHVDVGSRIDGFIGHLAVFREVEVLDIRPQTRQIGRILFHQVDLMQELSPEWIECTDSLSCLHTIEHFGLGRYGDTIDPAGHLKGLEQLKRMVKPGGMIYLSTPIGPQRIEFNAHRIFSAETLIGWFQNGWEIQRFAFLDDNETMHADVDLLAADVKNQFGCQAGVGIVAARKK